MDFKFIYDGFLVLKWRIKFVGKDLYYQCTGRDGWIRCDIPDCYNKHTYDWWYMYTVDRTKDD